MDIHATSLLPHSHCAIVANASLQLIPFRSDQNILGPRLTKNPTSNMFCLSVRRCEQGPEVEQTDNKAKKCPKETHKKRGQSKNREKKQGVNHFVQKLNLG